MFFRSDIGFTSSSVRRQEEVGGNKKEAPERDGTPKCGLLFRVYLTRSTVS